MSRFFSELKCRNVFKSAIAYLVAAWVLIQEVTVLLDIFYSPGWVKQAITIFLIIGLPIWIIISWIYDPMLVLGRHLLHREKLLFGSEHLLYLGH